MKSFRLDPQSVPEFLNSWPAIVAGILLGSLVAYVGIHSVAARIFAVLLFGVYGGYLSRGVTARRIEEKYPGARWTWLLSIGLTTCTIGVGVRMAFPSTQGTGLDMAWLGVTFCSILVFVLANRKNPHVVR